MISVVMNGETLQVNESCSLLAILQLRTKHQQVDLNNVAVALNQHIVPKSEWQNRSCLQGDQIDLFSAVAGG